MIGDTVQMKRGGKGGGKGRKYKRDSRGRFAGSGGSGGGSGSSRRSGATVSDTTVSGFVGGGLPGAIVSHISKRGFHASPMTASKIGGAVGGGIPGYFGAKVTQSSLAAGQGLAKSAIKGYATRAVTGIAIATPIVAGMYVFNAPSRLLEVSKYTDNDVKLIALELVLRDYASRNDKTDLAIIKTGKINVKNVDTVDGYVLVSKNKLKGVVWQR